MTRDELFNYLARNLKGFRRKSTGDYEACCPLPTHGGDGDTHPSLNIAFKQDRVLIKCRVGCRTEDILRHLGLGMRDLFFRSPSKDVKRRRGKCISLVELASAKGLPVAFLEDLGLHDLPDGGVGIPYRDEGGNICQVKRRTALAAKNGSYWPAGVPLMAYGLERLEEARRAGYLVLVEGESDCWALWHHGFPTLGIPGASAVGKVLERAHVEGISRLYVWREPDSAGETFVRGVSKRLQELDWNGQAFVVGLEEIKDPAELHKRDCEGFKEAFQAVLDAAKPLEEKSNKRRPMIQVNDRFLRDVVADAVQALAAANEPPTVFLRGSELVRVAPDAVHAEFVSVPMLRILLDQAADFVDISDRTGEVRPARPPRDVCESILAMPLKEKFPPLAGIRSVPVFLPDGRLLATEGYDPESGLLLRLRGLDDLRTDMPPGEALSLLLNDLLGDFPFADEGSRAHALALLLQPFLRQLIDGPTPLYLIDAPIRGAGKGLLAAAACLVATGTRPSVMTLVRSDAEEHEKRITALLLAGAQYILIDNVEELSSSPLSAALTAAVWRGRRLGKSEMVSVPNDATWVATGNNVELSDEVARRTIPVRLDPGVERPEYRTGFRHPELLRWVAEQRAKLVSACLSLV